MPKAEFAKMLGVLTAASERFGREEMPRNAWESLEMSVGHHVNPHGVIASAALLDHIPWPSVVTYDWVHCMLQGGMLNHEVEALLQSSTDAGVTRDALLRFLADKEWSFPHHHQNACRRLHRVFDARRAGDDESGVRVKGSCSELLALYGLLRFFFELKLGALDTLQNELASFRALCDVLDIILAVRRGFLAIDDGAEKLTAATKRHLELLLSVYGPAYCIPKHHWVQDLAAQILKDKVVLDAFIIERTHLSVKSIAENIRNTTSFEESVLCGLLTATAARWREGVVGPGLRGRRAPMPGVASALIADAMDVFGTGLRVGDVVVRGTDVGEIAACAQEQGELFVLVVQLGKERQLTSHCDCHRKVPGLAVWRAIDVVLAVAWQQLSDGIVLVLRK